ncbi:MULTISPECIES: TolC family protein [unclassified Pseudomonas]|uniref:TolC family protein n=1 Tax=unclassified Pseudomonas TaxID=196821 RepID=UPI0008769157|nr:MULTISPECIES: TolC family protein [unclassified Pseudomonas]SCZ59147.1 outer membrane protein, cobalt-zinc-cadmium efflux system [Pseudomonas sp. NFPP17]SDA52522.1 outer membrane protein, cobalt-zinc-cadmium efflux system [Pseudomonas sp. NFPP15]SEK87853.1 outer membrane protein, cobalt-zinc-cadmium efflux system [Pseudomonas sp. NFPP18]SFA51222.1 outer membrane protein, cobalt-zinc-cadmium efflux system [Pseudomonas sp. NFPP13]SFT59005.1 outer membrane protein, cobalt-zinc-cadmium efflux s
MPTFPRISARAARTCVLTLLLALASQSASAVEQPLLSLDSALARAFANNPELAAARWEIDIAQGARQQAGLIPNPVLSVDAEDTRRDSRTTSVKLSQALELGGKRGARIDVASRGQELAALELERRRNQLRADVLDAYYTALRAQERTQLAGRSLALAERGVAVAQGRVNAGKASPVEATRAQVQLAEVRLELNRGQMEQDNAYRRLAMVTGAATSDFAGVQEQPQALAALPAPAQLLGRLPETTELRLAEQEVVQREASLGLEKAQRIPDLDVSVGSQYDASARERVNLVGLSMPLPLFNRNQGNVLSAARRADQARDLRNATELRLRTETRQALEQWNTARGEVQSFNQTILPAAQRAVDSATQGFEMGKFSFLDVLDAQRTLIGARTQYLAALAQTTDAWVRIERIYGDLSRW